MKVRLGRMEEAVILDRIQNPEVLVAGGDFQNLLRRRQRNQRGVMHLGANGHDVVGVVMHNAGDLLRVRGQGRQRQQSDQIRFCVHNSPHWVAVGLG